MDAPKNSDPQKPQDKKQQGKKQKDKKNRKTRKLLLEASIPKKTGDVWQVVVTATLKVGQNCLRGIAVQFSLGAKPSGHALKTDESGNARKTYVLPSGEYTVFAAVEHEGPSSSVNLTLKEERKPPAKLVPSVTGNGNKRIVTFNVLDADNKPVKGSVIRAESERLAGGFVDLKPTDQNGTARFVATLKVKEATVVFSVLGTELREWRTFFAPQPQP